MLIMLFSVNYTGKQEFLIYMSNPGIVGLSIDENSQNPMLPIISQSGGIDFDFDSQSGQLLIVKKDLLGNVRTVYK